MNAPQIYDAGVSHQIGRYSDAIRVPAGYDRAGGTLVTLDDAVAALNPTERRNGKAIIHVRP